MKHFDQGRETAVLVFNGRHFGPYSIRWNNDSDKRLVLKEYKNSNKIQLL